MSATAQLMVSNVHQAEADFANTVLLASVRPLTIAFGAYQLGYGGAALYDGEYATGLANIGLGTLAIYGANAARAPTASGTVGNEVKVVKNAASKGTAPFSPIVDGGGLQTHENAGGHLLLKHVGQTEQDLMTRLANEPKISGSSSFFDRATAESAASQALQANQTVIADWLKGTSNRLRIDYTRPDPVGISVSRGATNAVDVNSSRIILVRDPSMSLGYKILTGFPTK